MHKIKWHIGCSGFSYREGKEDFYPKGLAQSKWFSYYAERFTTLELNVTFYKFPSLSILKGWYAKAPEGFRFSAKVPGTITHYKKFTDTHQMMQDFYSTLQFGLGEKLGCVLFQLPPGFVYSEEALDKILGHINPSFQNVIEFRHASWWRRDVQDTLAQHATSFCGVSFPKIEFDDAVINTRTCYYRFHGVPTLFYSEYQPVFIEKIHQQIAAYKELKEVFVYFNNTASLAALHNAKYFQQLIKQ